MAQGWDTMNWDPWYYYSLELEKFVSSYLLYILLGYFALILLEILISFLANIKNIFSYYKDTTRFMNAIGLSVFWTTVALIVGFVTVSSVFSSAFFFMGEHYDVVSDYYGMLFSGNGTFLAINGIIGFVALIGSLIFVLIKTHKFRFVIVWWLCFNVFAGIWIFGIGFVLYAAAYYVWMFIRFLYVAITSLGISFYQFGKNYWMLLVVMFGGPIVLVGLITALISYFRALHESVSFKLEGGVSYLEQARASRPFTPEMVTEPEPNGDIVISDE